MQKNYARKFIFTLLFLSISFLGTIRGQELSIFDIARKGTLTQLRFAVQKDANSINEVNDQGYSPLTLACYYSNHEVAKYLIENVKDVNSKSGYGTPLMAAAIRRNAELVKLLLEKGADPNATDINGSTALHLAVVFSIEPIIKLLVDAKANTSLKDNRGKTAMDYANINGNKNIIKLLKQ